MNFMKKAKISLILIILSAKLFAAEANPYDKYYDSLPSLPITLERVKPVVIPKKSVSILDYASLTEKTYFKDWDGSEYTKMWTKAINTAIKELSAAGGGHLRFPKGTYLSGPITLQSNVELYLEEGAILMASPNKSLYYQKGEKPYFIYRKNLKNISIAGKGTIDGNGEFWWPIIKWKIEKEFGKEGAEKYWKDCISRGGIVSETHKGVTWWPYEKSWSKIGADCIEKAPVAQESKRIRLIVFADCTNVSVSGITLRTLPKCTLCRVSAKTLSSTALQSALPHSPPTRMRLPLPTARTRSSQIARLRAAMTASS